MLPLYVVTKAARPVEMKLKQNSSKQFWSCFVSVSFQMPSDSLKVIKTRDLALPTPPAVYSSPAQAGACTAGIDPAATWLSPASPGAMQPRSLWRPHRHLPFN